LLRGVCTELRGVISQETSILTFRMGLNVYLHTHLVLPFKPTCVPRRISLTEGQDYKRYEKEVVEPIETISFAGDDCSP
jgi:hypothetical protein